MGGATSQSEGQLDMRKVPGVGHGVSERVVGHSSDVWGDEEVVHYVRGRTIYVDYAIQVIRSEEDLYHSLGRERHTVRGLISTPWLSECSVVYTSPISKARNFNLLHALHPHTL